MIVDGPMLLRALQALKLPTIYSVPLSTAVKLEVVQNDVVGVLDLHVTGCNFHVHHTITNVRLYAGDPGEVIVADRKQLFDTVKEFDTPRITIISEVEAGKHVVSLGANGPVPVELTDTFDPADYPVCPATDLEPIGIVGETFIEALTTAISCAAKDDSRPVLCGVHFETGDDLLHISSADGYVLFKTSVDGIFKEHPLFSLPAKELNRLPVSHVINLHAGDEYVRIDYKQKTTRKPGLEGQLTLQKIAGTVPDFQRVIDNIATSNQYIQIPIKALKQRDKDDYLVCTPDELQVMRRSDSHTKDHVVHRYPTNGSYRWLVPEGTISIDEYRMNAKFLARFVPLAEGNSLKIGITGSQAAGVIHSHDGIGVITPLVNN